MNKLEPYIKPCPVEYHDEDHTYTLKSNGKLVPGVTSIIDNLNKPFLVNWAAKLVAEGVKSKREELQKADKQTFDKIVDLCKSEHRRKKEEAADAGTLAHDWIDKHIDGIEVELPDNKDSVNAIKAFLDWEKKNKVEWLAGDMTVGSSVYEFGGRLDGIANIDGILTLIDFKTSNQISDSYFLQTAGYQICLEEAGFTPLQRYILRIPKDGKEFETLRVPTPLDIDKKTFLALRDVQKWMSYVNNDDHKIKENGKVKVDIKKTVNK